MDTASCGPSSAIQNLNKHTQRDTSLQHQRLGNPPQQQGVHQFRQNQVVDQQLNQEFQRFNSGGPGHDFATSFMEQNRPQFQPQHRAVQPQHQHQHQHQHPQQQQQQGWINDFSGLSIEQRQQPQVNNWSKQFMQGGPSQQQQKQYYQQQQQRQNQQPMVHSQIPNYSLGTFQNRINMNAVGAVPQFAAQTEHQQIHKLDAGHQEILENEFDRIEKELAQEPQTSEAEAILSESVDKALEDHDRDLFAETARSVENSMNGLNTNDAAMAEKFQQSSFLNLMHSIANKETVLENNELKTQENVSAETSAQDTASNLKSSDYIQPMYNPDQQQNQVDSMGFNTDEFSDETIPNHPFTQQTTSTRFNTDEFSDDTILNHPLPPQAIPQMQRKNLQQHEPSETQNHLPDPLAHIGNQLDGVTDPLTAARIISGGQVRSRDWEDDDDWLTEDVTWRKGQVVGGQREERFGKKGDDKVHARFAPS
ncbi:hypothetical protein KGF57_002150 [Candida theae]|uniref:Peroxin-20 n=1 Tax=Candida theae TaxID=1198502 RepID=A0AAD5BFJ8_9ASCO|nr:uncharacterized protein KGF57_002150 [Candida theae]KAI5959212.1 hypothetical protein KGF57_002150 [Candida theae]